MSSGIELRELRTFLTLAEELHFGRTAERLGVTPSRVSQTIRQLEARVGGRLFDRSSRRVTLTPAGEQLCRDAGAAWEQLQQALNRARAVATGVAGVLRLGMYSRCNGGPRFVEIVKTFEARYPDCRVQVVDTGFERDQLDWLRRRELDLLAMRLPLHDPSLTIGPVLSCEPRVLALATDHPLATRPSVSVEDFADCTVPDVPTLPRELMDAFIPPRSPSGRVLRRTAHRAVAEAPVRVRSARWSIPRCRRSWSTTRIPASRRSRSATSRRPARRSSGSPRSTVRATRRSRRWRRTSWRARSRSPPDRPGQPRGPRLAP